MIQNFVPVADEVHRLQGLRTMYGIAAPAPICADGSTAGGGAECQVVQAPVSDGARLVPDATGEIRLTYRQLAALIEDAVRTVGSGGTDG